MAIRAIRCTEYGYFTTKYKKDQKGKYIWSTGKLTFVSEVSTLSKWDTYILVAGPHQRNIPIHMQGDKEIKILYTSPKAINKTSGHGDYPRNTVVVFELA